MLVGILDNGCIGQHDVVICGMFVERYALQQVVLSGMHYSKLCLAVCWRSDSMMHWSASWALCCVGQLDGQYVGLIGRHD